MAKVGLHFSKAQRRLYSPEQRAAMRASVANFTPPTFYGLPSVTAPTLGPGGTFQSPLVYIGGGPWGGGLADSPAAFVIASLYSALHQPAPNSTGGNPMIGSYGSLLPSSGGFNESPNTGGFDWGGLISGVGAATFGYLNNKQQLKAQKQAIKLQQLALAQRGYGGIGMATNFSGVPAATGGLLDWTLGAGALGGAAALGMPNLGGLTDMLPGGLEEGGTGLFGPDMFASVGAGARQRMLDAVHPTSGERVYWRPVGRPILFSGDLSHLKKTRKSLRRFCGPAGMLAGGRAVRRRRRR